MDFLCNVWVTRFRVWRNILWVDKETSPPSPMHFRWERNQLAPPNGDYYLN